MRKSELNCSDGSSVNNVIMMKMQQWALLCLSHFNLKFAKMTGPVPPKDSWILWDIWSIIDAVKGNHVVY